MENSIPFLGANGFVPAPSSSGFEWSLTNVLLIVIGLVAGGYAVYYFFFKLKETNELQSTEKKKASVDSVEVMADRFL